jgi:hypothetical protein
MIARFSNYNNNKKKNMKKNNSHLYLIICDTDVNYTPLNLRDPRPQNIREIQERITKWNSRIQHGRHAYDGENSGINKTATSAWLQAGKIFPGNYYQ